jgi:hypothetical protein
VHLANKVKKRNHSELKGDMLLTDKHKVIPTFIHVDNSNKEMPGSPPCLHLSDCRDNSTGIL